MKKIAFALLLAVALSVHAVHAGAQVLIIASPTIAVDAISKSDIHDIFTGATTNLRFGPRVNPILLKQSPAHDQFLSLYIGLMETQFRSNWRGLLFAGQRTLPPSLDSEAAVVDFVAHHESTLGYIRKSTPHEGVKVLTIR